MENMGSLRKQEKNGKKVRPLTSSSDAVRGTDPTKSLAKLPPSKRSERNKCIIHFSYTKS
jgi:hypothetical protein